MTCINQYMKEHPDATLSEVIKNYCPCEFYNIDDEFEGCTDETWGDCKSCWDREIPGNKKENNTMTCREKLITEHPEWSEVIIMKCTDIFTPNEYFTIDGPELLWSDIYSGVVEECSEDEDEKDAKIKQLESGNGALLNELIEKRKRVAELVEAYSASLNEIDILKEKNDNQRSIIEGNRETINNLHNQIQDLLEKIELHDEEIDKLVEENERLRKSADILSDGIDHREKENTGLYNKVSELDRTIEEQQEKIKLRDEEIDKLVKENDELFNALDTKSDYNKSLNSMLNDRIEKYQTLRANIEMMGFEVGDDTVIVRPDKPHFATNEEVADKFNSCSTNCAMHPTDISRTIARNIRIKYDALIYVGFSHDDAMNLLPKWEN